VSYHKPKNDISWYIKNRKTPITYSTTATRDLIRVLAKEGGTVKDLLNRITYDVEAKKIIQLYIDKG
jgi:hypothetical protein